MKMAGKISEIIGGVLREMNVSGIVVVVERSSELEHGDYSSNVAFQLSKELKKAPLEIAEMIAEKINLKIQDAQYLERVQAIKPGFVNLYLSEKYLRDILDRDFDLSSDELNGKKIMVEYAHPNTHKEMHIGHMRTLITGEAISRLVEVVGAKVFRANYQGDIGPHVAKAIWGIEQIMKHENLEIDQVRKYSNLEKAHFLGRGYALGSREYEENKEEIDKLNSELYAESDLVMPIYSETRKWSLEYYDDFYVRFLTKFDHLFFESQMVKRGKEIVSSNIGSVFSEENGAVIFKGEDYGLHTRVFITKAGNPTYEGKEMANAFSEYAEFPFDLKMHIVGSEQAGYFQVVFKALELLDPQKFEKKQKHISMGMVTLTDSSIGPGQSRKMSSRTGDILRVDWLLDQVKEKVEKLITHERVSEEMKDRVVEAIVIGAVKYSVLKVGTGQNVAFDIDKSVSIEGNSGPYIQYTYARTQSLIKKAGNEKVDIINSDVELGECDIRLLRILAHFEEMVIQSAVKFSPNVLCDFMFELAHEFNLFYQKAPILKEEEDLKNFRLSLTTKVGDTLKQGLFLLGINAPVRM